MSGIRGRVWPVSMFVTTRRRFLAGTGAWLGGMAGGISAGGPARRTVSIIHTTDLHGHIRPTRSYEGVENLGGFARCATCIREWRRESSASLLVDAGDVYQGTPESHASSGGIMIGLFNRLGYDAWALGNHDFDWGPDALSNNLALSVPPVLSANLTVGGKRPGDLDGAWKSLKPWIIREVGGFRIALVGLITPGLAYWLAPETLGGALAEDPAESLRRSVAEVRSQGVDAVVVMAHMGWRHHDDFANPLRGLLETVPGVDVLIAGHTHQPRPSWMSGPVLCTQAGYHGIHCGKVDLTFDLETRRLVSSTASLRWMDGSVEEDPMVMELAEPEIRKSSAQLARTIGTVVAPIAGKGRDNPLAMMFCEAFAAALKRSGVEVDGVFHGTFGTGELAAGDITIGDCWKLLPYENLLVTVELGVSELIEILKEERSLGKSDRILWPFQLRLNSSGEPTSFTRSGREVGRDERFTIALNSYDSQSGGRAMMRLREIILHPSAKRRLTSIGTREALIDHVLDKKRIGG